MSIFIPTIGDSESGNKNYVNSRMYLKNHNGYLLFKLQIAN